MPGPLSYQAVLLAGGDDVRLHPLTSSSVKALLPVANRPLLSYSLNVLASAGLRHSFIVVMGDEPTASIQSWINQEYSGQSKLQCEVIKAPKDCHGTADALRAVAPRITARTLVVMSGDLLTDFPVNVLVAKHQMGGALATALLFKRKVSPTTETKPGKAPKNVDYIGLDSSCERLLFYASSPESLKDLKIPLNVARKYGSMSIASDLVDAHLYVFDRSVLSLVAAQPNLSSVRQDLLPFLTQQQLRTGSLAGLLPASRESSATGTGLVPRSDDRGASTGDADRHGDGDAHTGSQYMDLSHSNAAEDQDQASSALRVLIVPPTNYCARIADGSSYGEVNRDLADQRTALHLTGLKASEQHENVVPAGTVIGAKSTIAAACILGEGCSIGDKSSIKRSVLGSNCRLGSNVKILNSVLQDGVVVGDGATIQNSILCTGVVVRERAALKDCQVGAGFNVLGKDYNGETLGGRQAAA